MPNTYYGAWLLWWTYPIYYVVKGIPAGCSYSFETSDQMDSPDYFIVSDLDRLISNEQSRFTTA
jgi:hypothetical protein